MITNAIFSDESTDCISPPVPQAGETVRIKLRAAARDIKEAIVRTANGTEYPVKLLKTEGYFDFFEAELVMPESALFYHFRLRGEAEELFYGSTGIRQSEAETADFKIIPGFDTPEWSKGALMYQIFVDRFRRGDPDNDVLDDEYIYIGLMSRHISEWDEYPSPFDVGYFYGGDLTGVLEKLDYLQDLGVEVIYFNPLFVSPSNHKYDTQDYDYIDPHFGRIVKDGGELLDPDAENNEFAGKYMQRTLDKENLEASNAMFAGLTAEMHKRGMKVILDGVFNHCGSFNKWMDREGLYKRFGGYPKGAYESAHSPYVKYFNFYDRSPEAWPDNKSYDGWWGNDTLPKLFYDTCDELVEEIMRIGRKWLLPPYSIDGWRLDVAADLGHSSEFNHSFWKRFRSEVKSVNPEAVILAEHYGDPSSWLDGRQWDTVMNYDAFMEPVSWFLTGLEKHSDRSDMGLKGNGNAFMNMFLNAKSKLPLPSLLSAMNELSNHDHSRFLTRTNGVVGRLSSHGSRAAQEGIRLEVFRQAVLMQMTMPGAPTIYYGDEAGVCGWTDPDNRRSYPWGSENLELLEFHRYMNLIHTESEALKKGSFIPLLAENNLAAYARTFGNEVCIAAVYTGETDTVIKLPVWLAGINPGDLLCRVMYTDRGLYNVGRIDYEITGRELELNIGANSALILALDERQVNGLQ